MSDHTDRRETIGRQWSEYSMEYLVGCPLSTPTRKVPDTLLGDTAQLEMQRRSIDAINRFSRTSTWLAVAMITLAAVQVVLAVVSIAR